jgi:hypothetical protein
MELACRDIVFHFNKKHLEDSTVPMWCVKTRGKTYYVEHVTANVPWTTKETSDNPSTKGSIKFKRVLLTIKDNCAEIKPLTYVDIARISKSKLVRIIFQTKNAVLSFLKNQEIEHSQCRCFRGGCGSKWYVVELAEDDLTMLSIAYAKSFRILMENEFYYEKFNQGEIVTIDEDYEHTLEKISPIDLDDMDDDY